MCFFDVVVWNGSFVSALIHEVYIPACDKGITSCILGVALPYLVDIGEGFTLLVACFALLLLLLLRLVLESARGDQLPVPLLDSLCPLPAFVFFSVAKRVGILRGSSLCVYE